MDPTNRDISGLHCIILYIFIILFSTPFFPSFSLWLPFPTPSQQDYSEGSGGAAWYRALEIPA